MLIVMWLFPPWVHYSRIEGAWRVVKYPSGYFFLLDNEQGEGARYARTGNGSNGFWETHSAEPCRDSYHRGGLLRHASGLSPSLDAKTLPAQN